MYANGGPLLFSSNPKHFEGEIAKNCGEFVNSDPYHHQHQQLQSSGLMRYRSAPSAFFAECEEFLNTQSSSSDSETMFAKFVSGDGEVDSHDLQFPAAAVKHEEAESVPPRHGDYSVHGSQTMYRSSSDSGNEGPIRALNGFRTMEGVGQVKSNDGIGNGNGFSLMKQHSSPADFFSNITVENGVAVIGDVGNLTASNVTNRETRPSTSRLSGHIDFSSGKSTSSNFMPRVFQNGNTSGGSSSHDSGNSKCYVPGFPDDSWNNSTNNTLKRNREGDLKIFSDLNALETMNENRTNYTPGLTHHLSLPKTSAEMSGIENYLQFQQEQVPCNTRAKRGHATHPRSIAERVRRTRISQRMKKLQDLFPNMDKQANTADMLDVAVEYIKDLQKKVKTLTHTQANCTCSSKQKHSNPSG